VAANPDARKLAVRVDRADMHAVAFFTHFDLDLCEEILRVGA
jgi:hypothetical protein